MSSTEIHTPRMAAGVSARRRPLRQILLGCLAGAVLFAALAWGIYSGVTQRAPGANDFYSRWRGAQALLLEGENPYSIPVTQEIQLGMYGRLARPDEDQVAFAYPLYAAWLALPLVGLPYALAQAIWMAWLILCVSAGALALAYIDRIVLTPLAVAGIVLGTLCFYPSVRGIFLGQYALVSFGCVALAALALATGHDTTAGILLAVATVKPQPVVLLLPVILCWAWQNGRRRTVWSALVALAILFVTSFLWVPTWFGDLLTALRNYAQYAPVGPPLATAMALVLPESAAHFSTLLISAVLLAWMLWLVWREGANDWFGFQATVGYVAIVTTLIAGRIGSPDQVLLLIPWLFWMGGWARARKFIWVALAALALVVLPWAVFLATVQGNREAIVVTTVLPLASLAVYVTLALRDVRRHAAA